MFHVPLIRYLPGAQEESRLQMGTWQSYLWAKGPAHQFGSFLKWSCPGWEATLLTPCWGGNEKALGSIWSFPHPHGHNSHKAGDRKGMSSKPHALPAFPMGFLSACSHLRCHLFSSRSWSCLCHTTLSQGLHADCPWSFPKHLWR